MFDSTSYILYQPVQLVLSWGTLLNAREVLVLHFVNFDRFSLLIPLFKIAESGTSIDFSVPCLTRSMMLFFVSLI